MDPITVIAAISHIRNGLLMESAINAASLTSGNDRNDESQIAMNINPWSSPGFQGFHEPLRDGT